jgi:hypothetical protein
MKLTKSELLMLTVLVAVLLVDGWLLLGYVAQRRASSSKIGNLRVLATTNKNEVVISGLIMDSAFAVREIRYSSYNVDTIDVDLILTRGDNAPSGSFSFAVYLRPETRRIRLGSDRAIVFQR